MRVSAPSSLPHGSNRNGAVAESDGRVATKIGRPRSSRSAEVPQLLDMATVAATMATSVRHIQRLVSERRIPYLKVGAFRPLRPIRARRLAARAPSRGARLGLRTPPAAAVEWLAANQAAGDLLQGSKHPPALGLTQSPLRRASYGQ
jgi:hypothetical protein